MSQDNDVEKTEEPTPQRRQKARKEGQIPRSRELTSLIMLLVGWGVFLSVGDHMMQKLAVMLQAGLRFDHDYIEAPDLMLKRFAQLLQLGAESLLTLILALFFTALAAPMLLGGVPPLEKLIKFDLKKLNPLPGIKRLFSGQTVSTLLISILKVILVCSACAFYLFANKSFFLQIGDGSLGEGLADIRKLILGCLLMVILALLPMVGYDIFYQILSNLKKLRMSRQEIRDEYKQSEGDPMVKSRIKQLQRDMARRGMMQNLPTADVIVTNPTHFSVALRYKEGEHAAPVMVAKGAGELALRIREEGAKHRIPVLEAPPLARALYRHCEPGQPIPVELYSAVAEVLAWVYGLRRWRTVGGVTPLKPKNLSIPESMDFTPNTESRT